MATEELVKETKEDAEEPKELTKAEKKAKLKAELKEKKKEAKKKADGFFADFKKFVMRGNIIDMAIGVIVGSAFTAIVTALSNQIIKPCINALMALILGKDALSEIFTFLKTAYKSVETVLEDGTTKVVQEIDLANSIYIDWGAFINAIINFVIVATVLFLALRIATSVRKRIENTVNAKKIAADKAAAEAKAAEDKAAAEAKAAADKAAAEAKAETERQFYANVARQTELLEAIAAKIEK